MEGLGNDFIVVDAPFAADPEVIRRWCDRRYGIGADGVLEIGRIDAARISMRYWNADGGEAEMCGNGLRCLAALAVERGWVDGDAMTVATKSGELPAQVLPQGMVRALVGTPQALGPPLPIGDVDVHPVTVGNPHAVVFVDDPATANVAELGPRIETDPAFPGRTNVEFVAVTSDRELSMRIWERGVGETLASGTGAAAAAYTAVAAGRARGPVSVDLPGGSLIIDFEGDRAWMTGPGNVVFTGVTPD